MATKTSKRFTWSKPVSTKPETVTDSTMKRLKNNTAIRSTKGKIQSEYDAIKAKRRGNQV